MPEDFVTLTSRDPLTAFVAGNFRTGTTISVQQVSIETLQKFSKTTLSCDGAAPLSCQDSAQSVATALAAFRDRQTAPSGSSSSLIPASVGLQDGKLTFEMLLALVGDGATQTQLNDPELSRHTAVAAIPIEDGSALLAVWAGAKVASWDAGDGPLLQRATSTFGLRPLR